MIRLSRSVVGREEQLRLMRHDAPLALNRVAAMIETYRKDILAAVVSRVDAGYDLYGDEQGASSRPRSQPTSAVRDRLCA